MAGHVQIESHDWRGTLNSPAPDGVWYFGKDHRRFAELTKAKDWVRRATHCCDAINAVADRIRPAFVDLDDLLASGRFPLAWNASDLAECNPLTSDFYLDTCRVIALVEAVLSLIHI